MSERYQTSRAAEYESLADFRGFVKSVCAEYDSIDDQTCYDLQLAVDEACTNIIQHGYAGMNPGTIILTLEVEARQVYVTITDFGHPFEPSEPLAPDAGAALNDEATSGFGLFFIYQTMDAVDYECSPVGNKLKFIKQLKA